MQIVFFTHQFFPRHVGGTEVYTLGLARGALAAGHSVTVITCHESPSGDASQFGPQYTSHDNIPVIEIHYNLSVAPSPAVYEYNNPFVAEVLRGILKRLNPDLVHVMHAMKLSGAALEVCHALEIPFIVTLCDYWFFCPRHTLLKWDGKLCNGPRHPLDCLKCVQALHGFARRQYFWRDIWVIPKRNPFLRDALLKARRIIALSDFQKQLHAQNGLPADRIEVIRHGLDLPETYHIPRAAEEPVRCVFIGSLVEHKGVHILLQALAKIPDIAIVCSIYGSLDLGTAYIEQLREMAANDPRIRLMGTFEPKELSRVLAQADILALPALWYENEPLVIKAALHSGIPVLVSNLGSLPEMVVHGKSGWLVEPGNIEHWASMIEHAVSVIPSFKMEPVQVKSIDENNYEILSIYAQEVGRQ
jgi:glycosyltransferase involved in cell wall biosynthesis